MRRGLNANLGFAPADRAENIRRVGEVAALFADAGFVVIAAFISPYRADRERARTAAGNGFHAIFVKADRATSEARAPKGPYRRARRGEHADHHAFYATSSHPLDPERTVRTRSKE